MKLTAKILPLILFIFLVNSSGAQSIWHIFYDYWPSGNGYVPVGVKTKDGIPLGTLSGNKEFGLGMKVIAFGKAENYIRFAFMANYRHIQLTDNFHLADSSNKIQTVEYMLGGTYRPSKSSFRTGSLYYYFHATALAGMGWSYNFDASLSAGFSIYPMHGSTQNATGINLEFVYWPVSPTKTMDGAGKKLSYLYTVQPTWSIRLGFVFNSHINTTFD